MFKKTKGSMTIRNEMFLLSFLSLGLTSLLVGGIFLYLFCRESLDSARNSLRDCNSQIVTYTEGLFRENASIVDILARDATVINAGGGDASKVIGIYEAIHRDNANITYIYSAYLGGRLLINNYPTPTDYNPADRPWYQAAMRQDGVVRLVYRDAATDVWLFSQCRRLVNEKGGVTGAVAIDCSNESITRQLSTKYQYSTQRSFIVNPEGTILIHPDEQEINRQIGEWMSIDAWNMVVGGQSDYVEFQKDGVKAMAYFERIPQTDFIVVTAIDSNEITRPLYAGLALLMLLITAIPVLLGFVLSGVHIRRFAHPIMELGERIEHLAAGRPGAARVKNFSNAQINEIAENIELLVKDISEREELRKTAVYLSFHDSLTGLYNRRFFEEELRRLDVQRNYPLAVLCCDINGLKLANDVFGHAVGDRLIQAVARCLERGCRADDILARIGGDEFALILPRTTESGAMQVVTRIRAGFPQESVGGAYVSASLGFAFKADREQPIEAVVRAADKVMYEQKLLESTEMKRRTMENVIAAAECEGVVKPLTVQEGRLLDAFAKLLCPDLAVQLMEGYRLRKIGTCSLMLAPGGNALTRGCRHTENAYRILTAIESQRVVAGFVLHYMERWNGSGWPAGLSGLDIPLPSRIIALVEARVEGMSVEELQKLGGTWYDPELVDLLPRLEEEL